MKTTPRVGFGVILLAVVLALTGCVRMEADLTLSADDTLSGQIIVGYSDSVMEELDTTPDEMLEAFADGETNLSKSFPTEPYAKDGYTGYRHLVEDASLEDLAEIAQVEIERQGDEFVLTGELSHQGLEDLGTDPESAEMFGDLYYRMAITFPGPVSETNGAVEGTTVTWESTGGEVATMDAVASALSQEELDAIAQAEAEAKAEAERQALIDQAEAERQTLINNVTIGVAITVGVLVLLGLGVFAGRLLARREPETEAPTRSAPAAASGGDGPSGAADVEPPIAAADVSAKDG
ncbi:LppM family (lipo)protein [Myceligenerans xiligouense]|uniref:LppM domain-containing protein n=1 Tax=Myceligenerans xiligouense TaxID=253184 RepID=A0A3N4ZSS1_9MICO|nr:hypothetical protein [Myceligenerans xiligouense]RPF22801.1 hypothetical protein EDD34_3474 [Myceligenerans xiligouense]